MAVIMVYGGNFGRNSHCPVEFPVIFGRTVTSAEIGSVYPVKFGITQDSLSERAPRCSELWITMLSTYTSLFNIGLLINS